MTNKILSFILLFFSLNYSYGQPKHEILMMTGQVIDGSVTGQDSLYLYYDYFKRNGSQEAKKLDLERVFSIYTADGEETVVYAMDTNIGNYYSVDQMRFFIKGEQDAMTHYKGHWAWAVGLPVTAALGFVFSGSVVSFAIPFVYLVAAGIPKSKIPKDKIDAPNLMNEEAYVLGFETKARNKRLFKALTAGLVGTAGGFAAGQFVSPEP